MEQRYSARLQDLLVCSNPRRKRFSHLSDLGFQFHLAFLHVDSSGPRPRRVSIQQSPKIYGGKELSNYYKRLLLAGR